MIPDFLNKNKIPPKSGVYLFKDQNERILYVGKAINLKHRVGSYFSGPPTPLVKKIAGLDTIIVESELEALILEANLIKKYLPPFNVRLTDDKDYLYIGQTKGDFPQIITLRKQDLRNMKKYWGPFPSSRTVGSALKALRKVFPWCSQPPGSSPLKMRACFYYHLGLCPGACLGLTSKKDYQKIQGMFAKFMDGKKEDLKEEMTKEMEQLAKQQKFEEAQRIKKTIEGLIYLTQPNRVSYYLENPNFLADQNGRALIELQKVLSLSKRPRRIEGYDISNISGKQASGSMVVLTNGDIDKSQYRKFKIFSGGPNDVGMHREMIKRRLKHPEWLYPDLIIVDGGRGQAKAVRSEIENLGLDIPVYGLAKRMEWIYPSEGELIKLKRSSLALHLLQKLRDESHRFAINYHRKLRDKSLGVATNPSSR